MKTAAALLNAAAVAILNRSGIEVAQLAKAHVASWPVRSDFTDNDVIEDFNFEQLSGADQIAGDLYVGVGRRRIAARVIVHQENGGSGSDDCGAKDFARMNVNAIQKNVLPGLLYEFDSGAAHHHGRISAGQN